MTKHTLDKQNSNRQDTDPQQQYGFLKSLLEHEILNPLCPEFDQ